MILGYDIGGLSNIGNAWGTFELNENSDYLYKLIKTIDIYPVSDENRVAKNTPVCGKCSGAVAYE